MFVISLVIECDVLWWYERVIVNLSQLRIGNARTISMSRTTKGFHATGDNETKDDVQRLGNTLCRNSMLLAQDIVKEGRNRVRRVSGGERAKQSPAWEETAEENRSQTQA